jgi:hypothetical protein
MSENHYFFLFENKWRAETQQPVLKFDSFNSCLKSGIFKCISWLNGSFFFFVWYWVFFPFFQRESRPIQWHQCRFLTRQLHFCLHIYSLWFNLMPCFVFCSPFFSSIAFYVTLLNTPFVHIESHVCKWRILKQFMSWFSPQQVTSGTPSRTQWPLLKIEKRSW